MIKRIAYILICGTFLLTNSIIQLPDFCSSAYSQQYIQLTPEQMKAALRCPNDASKAFVDDAYELVSLGILPESLVISSFNYAYKQNKNQWFYFQKSLELRTEKMNIDLDSERRKLRK